MKTQTDLVEANRRLKGRITLMRFNADTGARTMTNSGLSFPNLIEEIVASSRFNKIICKMFIDLPYALDGVSEINDKWLEAVEQYEMNLYI